MTKKDRDKLIKQDQFIVDILASITIPVISSSLSLLLGLHWNTLSPLDKRLSIITLFICLTLFIASFLWIKLIRSNYNIKLNTIDLVLQGTLDVLWNPYSTFEEHRDAFEAIQELYEPKGPLSDLNTNNIMNNDN